MTTLGISTALLGAAAVTYAGTVWGLNRVLSRRPAIRGAAAYVPFKRVTDAGALEVLRGRLVRCYHLVGTHEAALSPEEQEDNERKRANALAPLLNAGCVLRLHAIRDPATITAAATYENAFLEAVHEKWMAQFKQSYTTRRYLTVESPPGMAQWQFDDLCTQAETRLQPFVPRRLPIPETLEFYGSRLDPVFGGIRPRDLSALTSSLMPSEVSADRTSGVITVRQGETAMAVQQVSVEEWSENDGPMIIDGLLSLPVRLEVTMILHPVQRATALTWLDQKRKHQQSSRSNEIVEKEMTDITNQVQAGRETATRVQLSITVIAPKENLAPATAQVFGHLSSQGIKPVIETKAAAYIWFSRLPGYPFLVRARPLVASNVGKLWRWEKQPDGIKRSDWGDGPVRLVPTMGRSAYAFQFHISDRPQEIGHTLVLAPSRGGKTTALLHLLGGAMRHPKLRAYIFDRNLSTRVFVEAAGGKYVNPHDTATLHLNPLQGPDTKAERDFVTSFLTQLAGLSDIDSRNAIADATRDLFTLPPRQRSLARIHGTAFAPGKLKDALRQWADPTGIGALINADRDGLSLTSTRLMAFDYTQLFRDPIQAAAVTSYLMHRIRQLAVEEASPHFLYFEEIAPMLQDPFFAQSVQVFLREHAKLRGVCALVFQEVGAALNGPIGETLLTNCPRVLIFPNSGARAEEYAALNLSAEEWSFVKGDHPANRALIRPVLSRTDEETAFLDFDLSPIGGMLAAYRGGSEPVANMHAALKEHGSQWLDHFCAN